MIVGVSNFGSIVHVFFLIFLLFSQGFVETRRKLLGLKSNLQQNWTAYAVANHVAGNAETTVQAIDAFVKTLKVRSTSSCRPGLGIWWTDLECPCCRSKSRERNAVARVSTFLPGESWGVRELVYVYVAKLQLGPTQGANLLQTICRAKGFNLTRGS